MSSHLARFADDIAAFPPCTGFGLLLIFREVLVITDDMAFDVFYLHLASRKRDARRGRS